MELFINEKNLFLAEQISLFKGCPTLEGKSEIGKVKLRDTRLEVATPK